MEELVKENIEAAQAKQKYYNEKLCASSCFSVGSTVLIKGLHKKEAKRWKAGLLLPGPHTITAALAWERTFSTKVAKWRHVLPFETTIYTSQLCHSTDSRESQWVSSKEVHMP